MAHGWGLTEFAGRLVDTFFSCENVKEYHEHFSGSPSDILQFVELKRYGMQRCKNEYAESSKYEILSSQFCAGAGDESDEAKDTCEGDSGSGLVIKHPSDNFNPHFVLGVTSFGPKYCGLSTPGGVYTNVQAFLDWIEGIVWPL
jgi:secreted trypsin-like serine protease